MAIHFRCKMLEKYTLLINSEEMTDIHVFYIYYLGLPLLVWTLTYVERLLHSLVNSSKQLD